MEAQKKYIFGNRESKWAIYTYHLDGYMNRWILKTPFKRVPFIKSYIPIGNIRLHHILRSDLDVALHDHPFGFWTILLTGGYIEVMPLYDPHEPTYRHNNHTKKIKRRWGNIRWVQAEQPHRLILEKPVWTLVFAERGWRDWGFYLGGFSQEHWINHKTYFGIDEEE